MLFFVILGFAEILEILRLENRFDVSVEEKSNRIDGKKYTQEPAVRV